jgi:hypothetical protein
MGKVCADTNNVVISGTVGKEIELRYTEKGWAFLRFSLGVHRAGNRGRLTSWVPCICWRGLAELLEKRLRPGAWVCAFGAIEAPPPIGAGLPEGRCTLELVVGRAVVLGVECPSCAEGGACACKGEQDAPDAHALAEEAERGNPLRFDILSPEDQALVDAFRNANGLTPNERADMDAIAATFQGATEGIVGGTADPDDIPDMTPDEEVRDILLQARGWKAKMDAEGAALT